MQFLTAVEFTDLVFGLMFVQRPSFR